MSTYIYATLLTIVMTAPTVFQSNHSSRWKIILPDFDCFGYYWFWFWEALAALFGPSASYNSLQVVHTTTTKYLYMYNQLKFPQMKMTGLCIAPRYNLLPFHRMSMHTKKDSAQCRPVTFHYQIQIRLESTFVEDANEPMLKTIAPAWTRF